MAGKRIDQRAHEPGENRARGLSEDRGARKRKMRTVKPERMEGLRAKDEARMKAWEK